METRKKIMESAFNLFAVKGNEFSMSEIAKEVNIRKASIYAHFDSKESLLYEVIEKEINTYFFEIEGYLDRVTADKLTLHNQLKEIFFKILGYYNSKERLLFWKRLLLFPPSGFCPTLISKIHTLSEERYKGIKELVSFGIENQILKNQPAESIVLSFFSLIHGSLSSMLIYNLENIEKDYSIVWENFYCGLTHE
ncbi:MAG: TetR/AcrR family transcriptional regulator [Clostridia bacterium]|nr:TetR/AcrR family transcriptional regulator [Clostridia bacterium]